MKAILPVFDESRKRPYYLQLYDYIKGAILEGEIKEGEKLPSLRSLAKSTKLSITTIEQSYNQLLVEGYIYSKAQSGYYVGRVISGAGQNLPLEDPGFDTELPDLEDIVEKEFPSMQYDPDCFDFNKWKKCMNKILTDYSPSLFFEGDPQGEMGLRTEIARYLYRSRGVSCTPDQIIIGAGTQQITSQLATLLRKSGIEHVALEDPGYTPVRSAFRDRGFAITSVNVAENGLVIEKLPANIRTAAYVSPSNHIFTGSVMPVGRRYELLSWAENNDSYIIEDDYDSELRYFGRPIPALRSLEDKGNRVIYLSSFSSTLFAAVKISYMVLPPHLAGIFSSIAGEYSQTCSKLEQLTLAMFMETGNYQTHIKKLRKLYSEKLNTVCEAFASCAGDFVSLKNTSSGINVLLTIDSGKEPAQLKKEAESLGIPTVILPGSGGSSTSMIFYYNQIPLNDITPLISDLTGLWRQDAV
ncbi:MAG: PLP-dependent aminotransferase family protein [Clostridiales bacterium]|nr:PLP-dependent aminotransferase family protein [Clostridiales bacterium]MDD7035735.1 PLP-dependent aminotransferase family protein [Bacillota bacterium]MDY2920616.1 PLP-dependent aminotransferase family protein [Lentihominibacter sp.]